MSQKHVLIIGAGPGGYVAAIRAAQLGFKVTLAEKRATLGGTCLNVGCIPSKALLTSSHHFHFARERFATHGIVTSKMEIDVPTMMKRKDDIVKKLTTGLDFLMKKNKIERVLGTARFVSPRRVEVTHNGATAQTLDPDYIIIAAGSVPVELPFLKFDGLRVISSDQGIALQSVPPTMAVIGGGAIGLELGSVWSRLGSKVTIIEALDRIAAGMDAEVSAALAKSFAKQGLDIRTGTKVLKADVNPEGVKLHIDSQGRNDTLEAAICLVAVGRRPALETLNLEAAGVEITEKKRIKTDGSYRTSQPHIFAIGDIIDGPMLAHKAEEEGIAVAEILAGLPGHVNYNTIPAVIYTSPEAASVGHSEEDLKAQKIPYRTGKAPFAPNGRALANDMTEGFVKILAHEKTDRILGVHIVSEAASELIAEAAALMEFSASAEDIARTTHAHPTMAETLREAAFAAIGRPLHG